jgi:tetratricopeptide (TPR) repeat protein
MGKFFLSVIFLLVPAFALSECTGPQLLVAEIQSHPSAALYGELGNWFVDHHQSACAIKTFRAGLELVPDSSDLLYLLGLAFDSSGNPKDAIAPLQQAIQIEPGTAEYHLLLGAAFNELQQKRQAARSFENALAIDRHSIVALDALSKLLIEQGRYGDAIKLLHSEPRDQSLTLDLAQAYHKAEMFPQALEVLLPAVRANPSFVPLSAELVNVYLDQNRYPEAAQFAGKIFRLHPGAPETQRLYLRALVLNRDIEKARPFVQTLLAARPHDFQVVYWSGLLERDIGQYDAARKHLEEAVALDPADSNARYNLGIVLSGLGDYAGAEKQLQKSLALCAGGNEPQVRYRLASVLRSMGEMEQAKKQFKLTEQELQANGNKKLAYQMQGC